MNLTLSGWIVPERLCSHAVGRRQDGHLFDSTPRNRIPSPALFKQIGDRFRDAVHSFAKV